MKNLLKLTVLAFTVVLASCTNYDDQFASLEAQIATLKTQVEGFSTLSSGLSTLQGTVTSLQAAVAALPTSTTDISGLTAGLAAAQADITAITTAITALAADVAAGNTSTTAAQASIAALQTDLTAVQTTVSQILASNNVYTGDVVITNSAELAFAKQLAGKVAIINGDVFVKVNTANALSGTEVSSVTKLMTTVVGSLGVDTNVDLDFGALTSVSGDYVVVGHSISAAKLTNVGSAYLDYDGSLSIGDSSITTLVYGTPKGATTLDFGNVTTNTTFKSATTITTSYSSNTVSYTLNTATTTLNLGDAVTVTFGSGLSVNTIATTTTATAITINKTTSNTLVVNASKAAVSTAAVGFTGATVTAKTFTAASAAAASGAVDINADSVSLPLLAKATAGVTITLTAAGELNLPVLKTATTIVADGTKVTALKAAALTSATSIDAANVTTLDAPLMASGTVTATKATTVNLGNMATASSAPKVVTLTLSAQSNDLTTASRFVHLSSLNVTGKSAGTAAIDVSNTTTTTSVIAKGPFNSVTISGAASVTAITTSGVINDVQIDGTSAASMSLAHTHKAGGSGSILAIVNNDKLTSLTTSTDYMNVLNISGNDLLTTLDMSSYSHKLLSGTASLTIAGNKLTGAWTTPTAVTSTTAYAEAKLTHAGLSTLKTFVTATASGSINLSISGMVCTINGGTSTATLATLLTAGAATSTLLQSGSVTGTIDHVNEYTIVQ
jgi:hypothetical protein